MRRLILIIILLPCSLLWISINITFIIICYMNWISVISVKMTYTPNPTLNIFTFLECWFCMIIWVLVLKHNKSAAVILNNSTKTYCSVSVIIIYTCMWLHILVAQMLTQTEIYTGFGSMKKMSQEKEWQICLCNLFVVSL